MNTSMDIWDPIVEEWRPCKFHTDDLWFDINYCGAFAWRKYEHCKWMAGIKYNLWSNQNLPGIWFRSKCYYQT